MIERFEQPFPEFHHALVERSGAAIENLLPPATEDEIAAVEQDTGVPLPESYKRLLRCTRGFWLLDGVVRFGSSHPFFHRFPSLENLSPRQRETVTRKGSVWPPASDEMLCFAEFFLEADGDQVLWDVRNGLQDGEYPIYYYAHDSRPPSVRHMADRFDVWLGDCLSLFDDED